MPLNVDLEYITKKAEKLAKTLSEEWGRYMRLDINREKEYYAQRITNAIEYYAQYQPQPLDPAEEVE